MTRKSKETNGFLIEVFDNEYEREKLKKIIEKSKRNEPLQKYLKNHPYIYLALVISYGFISVVIGTIFFLYLGVVTHEFFHLITVIYFGVNKAEYYADIKGGYVHFVWKEDNITKEELSIIIIAGSFFNLILYMIIFLYFYRKGKYKWAIYSFIPILTDAHYWFVRSTDYQILIRVNPNIDMTLVIWLMHGILILVVILMLAVISKVIIECVKVSIEAKKLKKK